MGDFFKAAYAVYVTTMVIHLFTSFSAVHCSVIALPVV